jgi:hypothetical protein
MPDGVSDTLWKLRYKVSHLHHKDDKTLDDFASHSLPSTVGSDVDASGWDTKAQPADVFSKEPTIGSNPSIKTFYEGPHSRRGNIDWVDYPPKPLSKSAAKAQERVAIKVYKTKDPDKPVISGRSALKYHKIEVQNPLLVTVLDEILKKQDVHFDVNETATFNEPFSSLYFGYDDIVAKYKTVAEDNPVKPFMLLFMRLIDEILGDMRIKLKNLRSSGLVSYKLAWAYFPKDCTVVTWDNDCELLYRVVEASYKQVTPTAAVLSLRCKALHFNGSAFAWESAELEIPPFTGNKPITELSHYPLAFHQDADGVKRRLTARGKKVLDYQGLTYCSYDGVAIYQGGRKIEKHNVRTTSGKSPVWYTDDAPGQLQDSHRRFWLQQAPSSQRIQRGR